jgi:ankyrin repeat protein
MLLFKHIGLFLLITSNLYVCQHYDLIGACADGNKKLVYDLIDQGHDPNHSDEKNGWTPLMYAIEDGDLHLVEILLLAGGNPNKPAKDGLTAVIYAITLKYYDIAELLFRHGANPEAISHNGMTPLIAAENSKNTKLIELVEKYLHTETEYKMFGNMRDGQLSKVLIGAHEGNIQLLKEMVNKKQSLDVRSVHGWSPLHLATSTSQHEVMLFLLENNANPNDRDKDGWAPLMFAAHVVIHL